MSGAMEWLYLGPDSGQLGPISANELISRIKQGSVLASTLAWTQGQAEWLPVSELPPFKAAAEVHAALLMCVGFREYPYRQFHDQRNSSNVLSGTSCSAQCRTGCAGSGSTVVLLGCICCYSGPPFRRETDSRIRSRCVIAMTAQAVALAIAVVGSSMKLFNSCICIGGSLPAYSMSSIRAWSVTKSQVMWMA